MIKDNHTVEKNPGSASNQDSTSSMSRKKPKSQFGNHNTKRIMIIDGICIIPTSPKIVYRDLVIDVTDYCI